MNYVSLTSLTIKYSGNISEDITKRFAALFPSWPIMLATVIAFIVILIILTKLVYKPAKKMMKSRQKFIQKNIDLSKKKVDESNILYEKANIEILDARLKAEKILKDAKFFADKIKSETIQETKNKSKQLLEETKNYIEQQKKLFKNESKKEIIDIAGEMTKKILAENNGNLDDENFIKELLKNENSK